MRKKAWVILVGGAGLLGLVCVGILVYLAWPFVSPGRSVDAEIARLKAQGKPVCAADLRPPHIPDSQNAAVLLEKAFKAMPKRGRMHRHSDMYTAIFEPGQKDDHALWSQAVARLRECRPAMAIAKEAVRRPRCRFAFEWEKGWRMGFEGFREMRELARLFAIQGVFDAREGRIREAVDCLETGVLLGECLKDEPGMIPQLARFGILETNCRALRTVLRCGDVDLLGARRLDLLLARIDLQEGTVRALEGERATEISMCDELWRKGLSALEEMSQTGSGATSRDRWSFGKPVVRALVRLDEKCYLERIGKAIEYVKLPYREIKRKHIGAELSKNLPKYALTSGVMLPVFSRLAASRDRTAAQLDGSRIALGLAAYKGRFHQYPQTLAELKSKIGWEVPEDPFSGKDFVYKRRGDGFLLYSIGPDLKDDGGVEVKTDSRRFGSRLENEPGDIVWEF